MARRPCWGDELSCEQAMTPIYILEDGHIEELYPLTYTRPAFLLRCGASTLLDRMCRNLPRPPEGVLVRDTLAAKVRQEIRLPVNPKIDSGRGAIFINARWIMTDPLPETPPDAAELARGDFTWVRVSGARLGELDLRRLVRSKAIDEIMPSLRCSLSNALIVRHPWELVLNQRRLLLDDFAQRGRARLSEPMPGAHLLNPDNIYIGPEVKIFPGVVLDATNGPIIIERGSEIRPNAVITGPACVGAGCIVRTGADIREDTTLGPNCRVGGEVSSSIFLGNSNKQHEGFVGQSVIGEWVNLGAGTITSNLKNTYGNVRMPVNGIEQDTGLQFQGSIIGDHAKIGIGTCLTTGTVIGFSSHVIAARPPKFVPSFGWVTDKGISPLDFDKAIKIAKTAMQRRSVEWTAADDEVFGRIYKTWRQAEKGAFSEVGLALKHG